MTFLNPVILFGLVAAAIPIAIHLFGRRRPRHVPFSAMVFLEAVRRQQFRRLKLRHWILLALRTLFILFLVLAFARPAMRAAIGALGTRGESATVVVFDDGPGMTATGAEGSRFDRAREQVAGLLPLVGANDWAVLIRTSHPDLVLPLDRTTVASLEKPSAWSGDGMAALRHAAELLGRSDAANRELVLVTDLAGPPWTDLARISWPDRLAAYRFAPPDEDLANLTVDSVSAGGELVRAGRAIDVAASVRNTGSEAMEDAVVSLWLDDRRVQQKTVSVDPGARTLVSFAATLPAAGWITGRVEIDDDPLVMDNSRGFAIDVPPETNLLIVGNPTPARDRLAAIFVGAPADNPYNVATSDPGAVSRETLDRADVVVLDGGAGIDERLIGWLREATARGAGLLFVVEPETDLAAANRQILPIIGDAQFVGLRSVAIDAGDSVAYFAVEPPRAPEPLVAGLFGRTRSSNPRFADYAVARRGSSRALVSFATGDPWLLFSAGETARGAIVTAGLSEGWGDLAYRGLVVPLFHRLVNALARPVSLVPEYSAGQPARRILSAAAPRLELESPDEIRRALAPIAVEGGTAVDLGVLDPPGFWRVRAEDRLVDVFAVNLDPAESILAPMRPSAFREATGLPRIVELEDDAAEEIGGDRQGTELAILFLLAALACLAAELWLMRGIGADARETEPTPVPRAGARAGGVA